MVRLIELTTDAAGERMEQRRGGLLRLGRPVERILRTYSGGTEDPRAALLATCGGCLLDLLNDGNDPLADLLRRQILPIWTPLSRFGASVGGGLGFRRASLPAVGGHGEG